MHPFSLQKLLFFLAFLLVSTSLTGEIYAAEPTRGFQFLDGEPVQISCEHLEFSTKSKELLFIGTVKVTTAELTIQSDRLQIQFDSERKIQNLEATGRVVVLHRKWEARSEKLVFSEKDKHLVLTGNPQWISTQDRVTGDQMTYHLPSGKMTVSNASFMMEPSKHKNKNK